MRCRIGRGGRVVVYLVVVAAALLGLAVGAYTGYGSTGLSILDVIVSGVLAAALVIVYFQQTSIIDYQRRLRTEEFNREARQQHTETLRQRVALWHGNPERTQPDHALDHSHLNLPAVKAASFESAPTDEFTIAFPEPEPFYVVPRRLEGDRYLADLLENHAPDLRETKQEIESLYKDFQGLRDEFVESFDAGIVRETEEYRLVPADWLAEWMFELLVRLNREGLEDFAALRERAHAPLEQADSSPHPEKPWIWVHVATGGGSSTAIYSARWDTEDRDQMVDKRSEAEAAVAEVLGDMLDQVEERRPYPTATEAADTLDATAAAVDELEQLLVEYHGRLLYPGDCKYLEETRLQDTWHP